jgi:hypothetical protein
MEEKIRNKLVRVKIRKKNCAQKKEDADKHSTSMREYNFPYTFNDIRARKKISYKKSAKS